MENGILGTWDTSDYEGLYALQLVVLRSGQRVETATIQVTIDNLPPAISDIYPENGQIISYDTNRSITIQSSISDNLGIETVKFYLDEDLISNQNLAPFVVPWRSTRGEHTLRIEATDLSGNVSVVEVIFKVE